MGKYVTYFNTRCSGLGVGLSTPRDEIPGDFIACIEIPGVPSCRSHFLSVNQAMYYWLYCKNQNKSNLIAFWTPEFREISISGREIDLNSGSLPPIPGVLATLVVTKMNNYSVMLVVYFLIAPLRKDASWEAPRLMPHWAIAPAVGRWGCSTIDW